jgi:glycosyltransferase involved in cell wall biosynthesis
MLHIITPEYPPKIGGVADFTRLVARGLHQAGETLHVWVPASAKPDPSDRFPVHAELGHFTPADLHRVGQLLDSHQGPHRLLVQWVPHGYGYHSMNLPFCLWLWRRASAGDRVELMVHEPYLEFAGRWRQSTVAAIHRVMTVVLLRAAARVWVTIPAWQSRLQPYALGRPVPFRWLPIPSGLNRPTSGAVAAVRSKLGGEGRCLIGHVSTYGSLISTLLDALLPDLLGRARNAQLVLIGATGDTYASAFCASHPEHRDRIVTTGPIDPDQLAAHIAACDVLVQPYPDGVSSRRTTTMAGLFLGVPVVTTAGHLSEPLWEQSGTVRLSAVGDWSTFNSHVCQLLSTPDDRRQLSSEGRRYYDEHFDIRHVVRALMAAA